MNEVDAGRDRATGRGGEGGGAWGGEEGERRRRSVNCQATKEYRSVQQVGTTGCVRSAAAGLTDPAWVINIHINQINARPRSSKGRGGGV